MTAPGFDYEKYLEEEGEKDSSFLKDNGWTEVYHNMWMHPIHTPNLESVEAWSGEVAGKHQVDYITNMAGFRTIKMFIINLQLYCASGSVDFRNVNLYQNIRTKKVYLECQILGHVVSSKELSDDIAPENNYNFGFIDFLNDFVKGRDLPTEFSMLEFEPTLDKRHYVVLDYRFTSHHFWLETGYESDWYYFNRKKKDESV